MRKRLLSLLLVFCMALTLLPGTAFAAVGGLLNNQAAKNESLLQQLQDFTGESYEEVYDLLDTLGLLDEDGNLVTDQTIDLDGKTYTLEEIEDLLNDPNTDLAQVAEVDGVPIALKDLATIIAIERQLQYLQEKYFTGATFEGESLENLNSLLEQLQGEGMTLAASGDQIVFDTSKIQTTSSGNLPIWYISTGNVTIPAGTTLSVKFKLNLSDAIKKDLFLDTMPEVYLSDTPGSSELTSFYLDRNSANSEIIYIIDGSTNKAEYSLSIKANYPYEGPLYLCLRGPSLQSSNAMHYNTDFAKYSFGNIWQAVSFYDAQGFLFGNGSALSDQWNGYFAVSNPLPAMQDKYTGTGLKRSFSSSSGWNYFAYVDASLYSVDDFTTVNNTLTYLQRCITEFKPDNAVYFHIEATLRQENKSQSGTAYQLIVPKDVFLAANSNQQDISCTIVENSVDGFPIQLDSGSSTGAEFSFTAYTTTVDNSSNGSAVLPTLNFILCKNTGVTADQAVPTPDPDYTYSIASYTTTVDSKINLVSETTPPDLTVSAPKGTYQSGDVIPITITGNEFIKATDKTQITINGYDYSLEELHGSTSGKYITFFYEVKEIDSGTLTVAVNSGITDYWGNSAEVNATVSGVTLETPILKNAVLDLTASYNKEAEAINFAISTKQDDEYQQMYSKYLTNPTGLMQLLISVNGGEAQTHTVTMVEGTGGSYAFTAEPYSIAPTTEDQTVTVQLQVKDGEDWKTVSWATQTVIIGKRVDVTGVTISVVGAGEDYNYTIALSDENIPKLQPAVAPAGAATSGTWYSTDETVAKITQEGQIELQSKTGTVGFYYVADNGTPDNKEDDETSNELQFTITAGDKLTLLIPQYAQETLLQSGSNATVKWNTNIFDLYPDKNVTFTVKLFAGTDTTGQPSRTYEVSNTAGGERITSCTIPAADLPVTYPQSQYTVEVSMASPEAKSADASITVLSPPTEMRITSDKTDLTDGESASLTCTIGNNPDASGTLSATRMADGAESGVSADSSLSTTTPASGQSVTFKPVTVATGLYDTYTITFTEDETGSANFAPSSDSIVLRVYRSGALEIVGDDTIELDNTSKVNGKLPTDSEGILELRQELGLIEYVSINADAYNWSSFRDGIKWVSDHPEVVGVYYRQGGLWDNIEDLGYETYLPQTQMAVSSTTDGTATITATHAATNMSDSVTVNVETLRDKFYLFQATPAVTTDVTYTNGAGETKTVKTNEDGLLAVYEESGIKSDVYFRSGSDKEPNLGTILNSALSSGERDAAKLQLYPLNTITLVPAAKTELYLVKPDGTPFANETVTLRGGVYLGGYYCEGAQMGATTNLISGATDGTYTTDSDGKLTVYMDATQFEAEGYTGQLTNAALDYWFELRNLDDNSYFPTLVHVQGSMSADRILRTGSSVVNLEAVPQGQENQPFLTAQTMSYGKESGDDLQVRDLMGSTGRVGPNSTYKYAELTSYFMLWGVDAANGKATVSMTGENGFVPKGQTVKDGTFPFSSIPIVTNTTVLTKETMTDSGWLKPETAAKLRACVYQNDQLLKDVSMPFQVIDLTDVKLVNEDAKAVVLDMQGSFVDGLGSKTSQFTFGSSSISNAFNSDIQDMLLSAANSSNPLFKVLITPTEDSTVFNVLIWGGYDSLELEDFDYDQDGLSMNYELLDTERQVGVPSVGDLSDMAQGNYHPGQDLKQNFLKTANSGLDFGAQLTGCYEGQFYYDVDQHEWAFRVVSGGFTAGAGVSFEANVNFWAGPVPITASFGAGLALQLDFKAATVYTDQQSDATLAGWSDEAKASDSVNDFLTTLRINGYISAFGGVGFDYSIVALKIGLFGKLTGDSTNQFLSQTYLTSGQQRNGQALGVEGEVGIKVVVKLLFISYDGALVSGKVNYNDKFGDYQYINDYWTGNGTSTTSLEGTPTLLSRAYLEAYANGERAWNDPSFGGTATVVQNDANPGSEPVVNDDGSISAYISDSNSQDFYDSRVMVGGVGNEGQTLDANGFGDLSPSLSGTSGFTVAAWSRLNTSLEKNAGDPITPDEQKQLLNSTEIMVATTSDGGANWTTEQLTDNASPDLAPVTAVGGGNAVVFWRNVYTSTDAIYSTDSQEQFAFDTKDTIYFSLYNGSDWSDAQMAYNGSLGGVVGLKTAMLSDGTSILVFTLDRGSGDPENPMEGYELAYRTVSPDGTLGNLVVLTNDKETDSNPQVVAADGSFILGWYSTQDGGDIRLQAVGADGQLYNGSSEHAVPASVKAISQEDALNINSNFQFAKQSGQSVDGLTLVWAETATNADGEADHSVLYGTQLCKIDGSVYLSSPQALITLPSRTLSNSFSAWKDSSGKINAYLFGSQYSETATETVAGYAVPADTDQLLTGGGSLTAQAVSVDAISVDSPGLRTESFTSVGFTLRNTGTTQLTGLKVDVDGYASKSVTLNPGESADVTVMYKTGSTISNPKYTVSAGSQLTSGTLHLDYNDVGISSMKAVSENAGKRTVQVTLYNDAAAKLENSGRTVALNFYTDSENTQPADVTLVGSQSGVSASGGSTVTLSGDALRRMDQGSLTFQVTYDLKRYVTGTLGQNEVPASGVYLYAKADVKENGQAMAEYATGNNSSAVLLTGAFARTGEKTTLDVTQTNSSGTTTAVVELKNNSLQDQTTATLAASLLDENDQVLETQTTGITGTLYGENTQTSTIQFSQLGSRVVVHAAAAGENKLFFDGLPVSMDDFTEDASSARTCSISGISADNTLVTAISGSGEKVTINGQEFTGSGSLSVPIGVGETVITAGIGGTTYTLHITSTHTSSGGGGGGTGAASYRVTLEPSENGTVKSSHNTASAGTTVTLTAAPQDGYRLTGLTVTDKAGKSVTLSDKGDGKYTFVMPSGAVTVKASFAPITAGDLPFIDVPAGAWYEDGVRYVYQNGLMAGTSATTFGPDVTTTRGMIATILWRLEGSPQVDYAMAFDDVAANSWYAEAIRWAASEGIVSGYGDGKFGPDDIITREQMAAMLYRYAQYKGYDVSVGEDTNILSYTDFEDLSEYAIPAMQWAVGAGIISGTSESTLGPRGNASRAQVAVILTRYCENVAKQ